MTRSKARNVRTFLVSAVIPLMLSACNDAQTGEGSRSAVSGLETHVSLYCHGLMLELERAAAEYKKTAPQLEEMPTDQRQRAERSLQVESIGVSEDVRREKLRDVQRRLDFCTVARKIDAKKITALQVRTNEFVEQLLPNLDGQLPSHDDAVKALDQLAAVARDIDTLPLLD